MKVFQTAQIRNIGLIGHGSSGKTTLDEALLFNLKATNRIGTIEQGSTISDYNEAEINRQISINTSLTHGVWKDTKINLKCQLFSALFCNTNLQYFTNLQHNLQYFTF